MTCSPSSNGRTGGRPLPGRGTAWRTRRATGARGR
jgi:hypothetical protein